jgi:taurine dioxygenase
MEEVMAQAQRPANRRSAWPFQITPLHSTFGVEIAGIALMDAVSENLFAEIYEAFLTYQLILFRDVDLPPGAQVALARRFGEVQVHVINQYHG